MSVLHFSEDTTNDEAGVEKSFGGAGKTETQGEKQRRRGGSAGRRGREAREKFSFTEPSFYCNLETK